MWDEYMLNTGSTGFMLLAASLVMLMTPGLAFFYGGLATKRNILGIMIQSFVSLGWTTVLWVLFGYSLCFSGGSGGVIGDFHKALLNGINSNSMYSNGKIPNWFSCLPNDVCHYNPSINYRCFCERINFKAYLIFLISLADIVYYPFVHMIWGGGLLSPMGCSGLCRWNCGTRYRWFCCTGFRFLCESQNGQRLYTKQYSISSYRQWTIVVWLVWI